MCSVLVQHTQQRHCLEEVMGPVTFCILTTHCGIRLWEKLQRATFTIQPARHRSRNNYSYIHFIPYLGTSITSSERDEDRGGEGGEGGLSPGCGVGGKTLYLDDRRIASAGM